MDGTGEVEPEPGAWVCAGAGGGLAVAVADGVLDGDDPAAGLEGWLPQAASMVGTAMASVTPATVVRMDFMVASSARHGRASGSALTI
jgi:hypothetical protein